MSARHHSLHLEIELSVMHWKTSIQRFRLPVVWLVSTSLYSGVLFADQNRLLQPHVVEVFTTDEYRFVSTDDASNKLRGLDIMVYEIDGIESMERALSIDMPADPVQSKQIALRRLQGMDDQTRMKMQSAAQGLAKAMQYGVDRYPAIVFDGQAVVYGVTDVQTALAHYQSWRREGKR
ncbi:TIGR03757 family integrating conjugative element protein [Thiolapillus sp.]|uniref:TIGR03757 family integrating conjugative element protein n=1 Tax=Thiolapillus sp. TaxID=2017437 RepID=UPI0025E43672|nr:TIGR03757 family integrating conjugative element protein [Thiolapillus sp.]